MENKRLAQSHTVSAVVLGTTDCETTAGTSAVVLGAAAGTA